MKAYRKILLVMILIFSLGHAILFLIFNIGALKNDGIWVLSFNIVGEMYVEIGLWSSEILMILVFSIGGIWDQDLTMVD